VETIGCWIDIIMRAQKFVLLTRYIKEDKMGEACSTLGEKKFSQKFYKEPEGKVPLRRSNCRWLDNVRMCVREIGQEEISCSE
jgi:hypothetical protein